MIFPGVDAPGYDDEALCRTCPVGLVSLVLILAPVPHVITDVSTSNGPALLGLQPLAHSCPCRKKQLSYGIPTHTRTNRIRL